MTPTSGESKHVSAIISHLLWSVLAGAVAAQSIEADVLRDIEAGRYHSALALLDRALEQRDPVGDSRDQLTKLRARCLYEMGDYARCESELRHLLESTSGSLAARRGLEAQLAQVLYRQGADEEALALAEGAAPSVGPEATRLVVRILLQRRQYGELGPHVAALLSRRPDEPLALFARGVAAAKSGDFRGAVADLERSTRDDALRRDALFELALAYGGLNRPHEALERLYAILSVDPFDAEACHQAGRQLLRAKDRRQVRTAAQVFRYFEGLRSALGASSRDHHLAAAGRGADAELERAARWERVGDLSRGVDAVRRAATLGPDDPTVRLRVAQFWFTQGLLAEGEAVLTSEPDIADQESVKEALARAASLRQKLVADPSDLARARSRLAAARWNECRGPLEELLRAARQRSNLAAADRAARLLLARDPNSIEALAHLAERTRAPELILPRLHYLGRLVRINGTDPRWQAELAHGERLLLGDR